MSRESIQINPFIDLTGFDLARELRGVHNMQVKKAFLDEFLGGLDDDAYSIVCAFVHDNP
jgi:hypothetical protein